MTYKAIDKVGDGAALEPAVETYTITVARQPRGIIQRRFRNHMAYQLGTTSASPFQPLVGEAYDYDVDWGDDTPITRGHTGDASHTYAAARDYKVRISGRFPHIYIRQIYAGQTATKIREINQWGNQGMDLHGKLAFYGARNLVVSAADNPNLSNTTDMSSHVQVVPLPLTRILGVGM